MSNNYRSQWPPAGRLALLAMAGVALCGCTHAGAPSFELFGAFFPAWMLCAFAGIAGALGARVSLVTPRPQGVIPYPLAVCSGVGVIIASSVWLWLFR